ncbi:hypothetical protein [Providencia sneebia]|uniref:Uncharacterized protein n=1 Tax=Providencia sneebia DSM 19967 TaxID=1141660 RepID=K8WIJ8_9GAMM|nr:hypothetical protein [Providencia sneebia]EKT57322.1 hypothetical protein OO7_08035 [Providencia sneebia DSM 19967]
MKKFLLPISILLNAILLILVITLTFSFFNLKNKVESIIEQVKIGQYAEVLRQNSKKFIPQKLKEDENSCEYLYQYIDSLVEYLQTQSKTENIETYVSRLNSIKSHIERTPALLRETACEKGISSINFLTESLSDTEEK